MRTCPTCSTTYPTQVGFCPKDGSPLVELQEWTPGATIRGKYRILSTVGKGGMGSVYKALHLGFHELRALKVLNPELAADARFVKRFKQEAFATRKLQHPNVVRVEDIDETEEGRPFIVMEFIEGRSLRSLIEKHGAMRMAAACSVVKQIASALVVAHGLGVVHRDLKPDNIVLVVPPKGEGTAAEPIVKVLDFGIATLNEVRAEGNPRDSTLTQPGLILGTPQYMSPEQAKGKRGDALDGRSDIYSLGILMYQMLTGELPFQGTTTMEMLLAHLQEDPRPIHNIRPDLQIPGPIADLVMQCLEKSREARPQTAEALIQALERAEAMFMEAAFTQESLHREKLSSNEVAPDRDQEAEQLHEHESAVMREHEAALAREREENLAQEREIALAREREEALAREQEAREHEAALARDREVRDHEAVPMREHEAALAQEREAIPAREREAALIQEGQAALVREQEEAQGFAQPANSEMISRPDTAGIKMPTAPSTNDALRADREQESAQPQERAMALSQENQAALARQQAARDLVRVNASRMVPQLHTSEMPLAASALARQKHTSAGAMHVDTSGPLPAETDVIPNVPLPGKHLVGDANLPGVPKKGDWWWPRGMLWAVGFTAIVLLGIIGFLRSNRAPAVPDVAVPNVQHELSTPVATPSPTSFQNEKKPEAPFRTDSEAKQTPEKVKPQKLEPASRPVVASVSPVTADNQARMLELKKQVRAAETEGDIFRERGEYDEAVRAYQKGLQLDPANASLIEKIAKSRRARAAEQELNR